MLLYGSILSSVLITVLSNPTFTAFGAGANPQKVPGAAGAGAECRDE